MSYFYIQNPILTFKLGPNIVFLNSKSYFDIRNFAEYRIIILNFAEYRIIIFKMF